MSREPTRIVILGGGFGGLYAAMRLDRTLARQDDVEVILVSRENFFLFTPLLHEVAASDLDPSHIVNPVRKLLRRVRFFHGEAGRIDFDRRVVHAGHGDGPHAHELPYDHLVIGIGAVTHDFGTPGVRERAFTMKSLADAMQLRGHLIRSLEEADFECACPEREQLLTVVVAGGGFAGIETAASIHDFRHVALRHYPNLRPEDLRMVVVHPGQVVLPELGEALGRYAQEKLRHRGVEILTGRKVAAFDDEGVRLDDGRVIPCQTLVWTAGTAPHPLVGTVPASKLRGRIATDAFLRVPGLPGVWAAGDAAAVPEDGRGAVSPPTAQHACRQGRILADNLTATVLGRSLRPFRFRTLGQLASLGRRTGVARVLGMRFTGFIAWWLWRTIYLMKLPRFEKKLRVALDWTLDLVFTKDLVQYLGRRTRTAPEAVPRAAEPAAVGEGAS
jgi:NADH dehydrogenase